jgi:cell division protein FtsB
MINLIIVMGIYTAIVLGGIYHYEDKVKNLNLAIEDYKRALNIAKGSDGHYVYLQLENKKLKQDMQYLSDENDYLQAENKSLKIDNQDLKAGTYGQYKGYSIKSWKPEDIQYESSVYKSGQWESNIQGKIIEL